MQRRSGAAIFDVALPEEILNDFVRESDDILLPVVTFDLCAVAAVGKFSLFLH